MTSAPWYRGGLRFECRPGCGACCTRHGDHGHVYLEAADVERLARFFELSPARFRRLYTRQDEGSTVLEMTETACPFLDGTRCTVYPARPAQCETFPFWKENLLTRARWQALGEFCPGIGAGPRHPLHVIRQRVAGRGPD